MKDGIIDRNIGDLKITLFICAEYIFTMKTSIYYECL